MIHTWVRYLLLPQLLIYHQASIVDEMNHTLDDQDDQPLQTKIQIKYIYLAILNY